MQGIRGGGARLLPKNPDAFNGLCEWCGRIFQEFANGQQWSRWEKLKTAPPVKEYMEGPMYAWMNSGRVGRGSTGVHRGPHAHGPVPRLRAPTAREAGGTGPPAWGPEWTLIDLHPTIQSSIHRPMEMQKFLTSRIGRPGRRRHRTFVDAIFFHLPVKARLCRNPFESVETLITYVAKFWQSLKKCWRSNLILPSVRTNPTDGRRRNHLEFFHVSWKREWVRPQTQRVQVYFIFILPFLGASVVVSVYDLSANPRTDQLRQTFSALHKTYIDDEVMMQWPDLFGGSQLWLDSENDTLVYSVIWLSSYNKYENPLKVHHA